MHNSTTDSWQEDFRARMYKRAMELCPESFSIKTLEGSVIDQKIRSNDPISDLNINKISDRSNDPITEPTKKNISRDPDGLNSKIRGKYADILINDESMLLARSWGVHPADLTKGFNRMGIEWVRKEINFVNSNNKVLSKGAYLVKLLLKNPY